MVVDRDGFPYYTGGRPELIKEYKKRLLGYSSLLVPWKAMTHRGKGAKKFDEKTEMLRKEAPQRLARRSLAAAKASSSKKKLSEE